MSRRRAIHDGASMIGSSVSTATVASSVGTMSRTRYAKRDRPATANTTAKISQPLRLQRE